MSVKTAIWKTCRALFVPFLLLTATIITFSYVVFSDMSELGGMYDIYRYYAPLTFFLDASIHAGEFPTWNPLTYCGLPNTGNPQSFLFYPPHLIRSLLTINPTPERSNITLALMMGLHFIFMAYCTYLFARAHKLSLSGALTAAVAFAFSALIVRRMCEYHIMTTIAWLPLLLLLIKNVIDTRDFWLKMVYASCGALVLGLSILGGFLQIINLMGLVAGVYAFFYFLLNTDWSARGGTWREWLRPWLHNGLAMALIFILGSLLAAVLLLPAWELASFTLRTTGEPASKYSDLWSWSPLEFYQKLVVYTGLSYEAETIRNSGIIALLLAFAGLTHHKRRDVYLFLGLFLLLFECSFGPPLPLGALLEKLTPFSLSAYSRAYDFGLLPLSMLAGYGVDALGAPMQNKGHAYARAAVLLLLAYICLAPLNTWLEEITFIEVNRGVWLIPMVGLVLMLALGVLPYPRPVRLVLVFLLTVLLFSETAAWNDTYVQYMARRKIRDLAEIKREDVRIPTTNYRENDPICNRFLYSLRFAMNGVDPLHISAVRDILSGPPRERHPFRGVQNWEPTRENLRGNMVFKRSFWLARQYAVGPMPSKRTYWPSATTVFLDAPVTAPIPKVEQNTLPRSAISPDYTREDITVPPTLLRPLQRDDTSRATITITLPEHAPGLPPGTAGGVHSALLYHYTSTANAQIDTWIEEPGTDRSEHGIRHNIRPTGDRTAFVEVPLPDFPTMQIRISVENKGPGTFEFRRIQLKSDMKDEDGLIRILDRSANTVDLQVGPLEEPRILTFLDSWYPGWLAFVDGERVPILRANEQFKAIVLPPGTHRVYFAFHHELTWQAFWISVLALCLTITLMLVCRFLARKTPVPDRATAGDATQNGESPT